MKKIVWSRTALAGVCGFILNLAVLLNPGRLCAGTLYVPNFSFESQVTPFADPRVDSWQKAAQPVTFDTNVFGPWENLAGVFQNPASTNAGHIQNANGNQLAYLFGYPDVALFQDFNSTDWSNAAPTHAFNAKFEAGKSYQLTVGLTSSSQQPLNPGSTIELSLYYRDGASNKVIVALTNVTYDTNIFGNLNQLIFFQVRVPAVKTNDAWAGQNIGIQFRATVSPLLAGGVWDLDKVLLTETIDVPNFSFESQPTTFADPRVDFWQKPAPPENFNTNIFGAWENLAGVFHNSPAGNPEHIGNADGNQLAYLFAYPEVALFQDFNSTDWSNAAPTHAFNASYKAGRSYKLTVGATSSSVQPLSPGSTLQLSLYYRDSSNNVVVVATTQITYDTNVFGNLTNLVDFATTVLEVKATDPWAEKNIGIQIQSTVAPNLIGGVWDLDNVRLTEVVATTLKNTAKTNGQLSFTLQSEPGFVFEILAGTNVAQPLMTWTTVGVVTNSTGSTLFTDPGPPPGQRFYRAHLLP
jgi:hypothetical protein